MFETRKDNIGITTAKRTISIVLVVLTLISVLPVFSFAYEKKISSIRFSPKTVMEVTTGISSGRYTTDKETGKEYYMFYKPAFSKNDKLIVTYDDDTKMVYKYDSRYDEFISWDSDGRYYGTIYGRDLKFSHSQSKKHWLPGEENSYYLTYNDVKFKIDVKVNKNPFKSVSASFRYPLYKGWDSIGAIQGQPDEYIIYKLVETDGTVFRGTADEVYKKYKIRPERNYGNLSSVVGDHYFSFKFGGMNCKCTYTVKKAPAGRKDVPTVTTNKTTVFVKKGDKVDMQLLDINAKNNSWCINFVNNTKLPKGLTLTKSGRLKGTVKEDIHYGEYASFDVRWNKSFAHAYVHIYFTGPSDQEKMKVPSSAEEIKPLEWKYIEKTKEGYKWYKFTGFTGYMILCGNYSDDKRVIIDSKGNVIPCRGYGDGMMGGGSFYYTNVGETYYIRVGSKTDRIMLNAERYYTADTSKKDESTDSKDLDFTRKTRVSTVVDGKKTLMNEYSIKAKFGNRYEVPSYDKTIHYNTHFTLFSPVDIKIKADTKSNMKKTLYSTYVVVDPADAFSYMVNGMDNVVAHPDKLRKGEKEYRFDTLSCYMADKPEKVVFDASVKVYVPLGYYIPKGSDHVAKHENHVVYVTINGKKVKADCNTPSKYFVDSCCTVCGKKVTDLKHTADKGTVTRKATATAAGTKTYKCVYCSKVMKKETIAKLGSVSLSKTTVKYTGKAVKPKVTVLDAKGNKISSSNYTVSYKNNIKKGQATVTVKFKNDYSGTRTLKFTIA